jgi:hypothetical protein
MSAQPAEHESRVSKSPNRLTEEDYEWARSVVALYAVGDAPEAAYESAKTVIDRYEKRNFHL